MFRVVVILDDFRLSGLEALDFCLRTGIAASPLVYSNKQTAISTEVDESFARSWFKPNENVSSTHVVYQQLVGRDISVDEDVTKLTRIVFGQLTRKRIEALYISGRFQELIDEVEHMKEMMARAIILGIVIDE